MASGDAVGSGVVSTDFSFLWPPSACLMELIMLIAVDSVAYLMMKYCTDAPDPTAYRLENAALKTSLKTRRSCLAAEGNP